MYNQPLLEFKSHISAPLWYFNFYSINLHLRLQFLMILYHLLHFFLSFPQMGPVPGLFSLFFTNKRDQQLISLTGNRSRKESSWGHCKVLNNGTTAGSGTPTGSFYC